MTLKPIQRENYKIDAKEGEVLPKDHEEQIFKSLDAYMSSQTYPRLRKPYYTSRTGDFLPINARLKMIRMTRKIGNSKKLRTVGLRVLLEYLEGTPEEDLDQIREVIKGAGLEKYTWGEENPKPQ